jgi:hypothetical protein
VEVPLTVVKVSRKVGKLSLKVGNGVRRSAGAVIEKCFASIGQNGVAGWLSTLSDGAAKDFGAPFFDLTSLVKFSKVKIIEGQGLQKILDRK